MIIRIKKRDLIVVLIFLLVSVPLIYAAASTPLARFKIELVISNRNPTIALQNVTTGLGSSQFSVDLIAAGTSYVIISFNVTDADGASNINATTAVVNVTLGSDGQYYSNQSWDATSEFGTCLNTTVGVNTIMMNCTVDLPYYANQSGSWFINISIKDKNNAVGRNNSAKFTINTVSGLALPYGSINFSNVNIGQQNVLAYPHLLINNTGNDDFGQVNMSAANLTGTTVTSENIAVTNFGVNLTNSSTNLRLSFPANGMINLRDTTTGNNVTFLHGHTSAFSPNNDKGNLSAFIWVNVPSSGLSSQLYNATWNVTAVTTP